MKLHTVWKYWSIYFETTSYSTICSALLRFETQSCERDKRKRFPQLECIYISDAFFVIMHLTCEQCKLNCVSSSSVFRTLNRCRTIWAAGSVDKEAGGKNRQVAKIWYNGKGCLRVTNFGEGCYAIASERRLQKKKKYEIFRELLGNVLSCDDFIGKQNLIKLWNMCSNKLFTPYRGPRHSSSG